MKWEYYNENMGRDIPVAKLCKDNGITILHVFGGRDSYYTVPDSQIFKPASITCLEARKMNSQEESSKCSSDVLFTGLKHACKFFEVDYLKQVENIPGMIE